MDEDLKNELLKILQGMREGAPEAFNELVGQRGAYCFTQGIILAALAAVCGVFAYWLLRQASTALGTDLVTFKYYSETRIEPSYKAWSRFWLTLVPGIACFIAFGVCAGNAAFILPEGFAPLGRVLEMLR